MATIQESVQEELVFIGTAEKHLQFAIGKRIRLPGKFYGGAEKAAIESGRSLEVSWATTPTPEAHKAALVLAYKGHHGRRPGFERHDTGEWVRGIKLLIRKYGEAYDELVWSAWMPMSDNTIPCIPEELGVYRVRAVTAPHTAGPEQRPTDVVNMSDDLCRTPIEEFILEVPAWRDKYLKNTMSTFKVEAFIQRKWESSYLSNPLYEDRHPEVNSLIQDLNGKDDLDTLEKDLEVIYRWGGGLGPRLFSQIVDGKNNPLDRIRGQMKAAFSALGDGRPVRALEHLKSLKYCSDSFGTKVLAMRSPESAPIWDEIAKACLREFTIGGKKVRSYAQFITFCERIAERLEQEGVKNPRGMGGRWYLRDIEMAIFQFGWDNGKFDGRITGELP